MSLQPAPSDLKLMDFLSQYKKSQPPVNLRLAKTPQTTDTWRQKPLHLPTPQRVDVSFILLFAIFFCWQQRCWTLHKALILRELLQIFFLGFLCNCFIKLLHNCEDHFHFYSLSAVHIYDLYGIHTISIFYLSWPCRLIFMPKWLNGPRWSSTTLPRRYKRWLWKVKRQTTETISVAWQSDAGPQTCNTLESFILKRTQAVARALQLAQGALRSLKKVAEPATFFLAVNWMPKSKHHLFGLFWITGLGKQECLYLI